ncbi:MAG: 50S ribosomal protein L4 [Chloroflexia bacterium]|nr:50S ribosomal protein L4 [Chloroflexia bacterium]
MQLSVHNLSGEVVSQAEVDDLVFGIEPNLAVMHQALLRQQANARTGTHNTLTRAHVSGGGRKPYRQKGTGHARQGSIRSPQFKGGGVVFGPHPRSYKQAMPRKMRRLAVRSALSQKVQEQRLFILSGLADIEPRTKALAVTLAAINVESVLIATQGRSESIQRAAGNLPRVRTIQADNLGVEDILKYDCVILDAAAVESMQAVLLDRGRGAGPIQRKEPAQSEGTSFAVSTRTSASGGEGE